jgi:cytochrome c oxidase subunit 3
MSQTATLDESSLSSYNNMARFGMIIFLASEAMLFAGLIAAYMILGLPQMLAGNWPPAVDGPALPKLPILMTTINTILLVLSSGTYHMAEVFIKKNNRALCNLWLLASIVLGSVFLIIQAYEWYHLKHDGLWFGTGGVYGSNFFILTGFHGLHVLVGVLLLTYSLLRGLLGHFSADNHVFMENAGLYWHFVDVVWIFVYLIIYIIPFVILPHFFKPVM